MTVETFFTLRQNHLHFRKTRAPNVREAVLATFPASCSPHLERQSCHFTASALAMLYGRFSKSFGHLSSQVLADASATLWQPHRPTCVIRARHVTATVLATLRLHRCSRICVRHDPAASSATLLQQCSLRRDRHFCHVLPSALATLRQARQERCRGFFGHVSAVVWPR